MAMCRFYIHVRDGDRIYSDDRGVEVADPERLLPHIRGTGRDIIDDEGGPSMDEQRVVEVVDRRGKVGLSLPFTAGYTQH
ncbi:MAG: DUF6894 family protein [Devosia sp.]